MNISSDRIRRFLAETIVGLYRSVLQTAGIGRRQKPQPAANANANANQRVVSGFSNVFTENRSKCFLDRRTRPAQRFICLITRSIDGSIAPCARRPTKRSSNGFLEKRQEKSVTARGIPTWMISSIEAIGSLESAACSPTASLFPVAVSEKNFPLQ